MKIPTPKNNLEKKIDAYKNFMPNFSDDLNQNLLKIKDLLTTGILTPQYYDLFNSNDFELNFAMNYFREEYIKEYGFFIITNNFISTMKEHFLTDTILEVGAGSGFLSHCLQKEGINITPTDKRITKNNYGFRKTYTDIIEADSVVFLKNNPEYNTVLMSWPNYDTDFADNILKNMNVGQKLIYIGEGYGGCTANDNFFERLELKAVLDENLTNKFKESNFSWFGIHDKIKIYKINK